MSATSRNSNFSGSTLHGANAGPHSAMPLEQNRPCFCRADPARGDRTWCCRGYGAANDSPTTENVKRIMELRPGKPAVADEGP